MTKRNHIIPKWYIRKNLPKAGPCFIYKYSDGENKIKEEINKSVPNPDTNTAFWKRRIYLQDVEDSFSFVESELADKFRKFVNLEYLSKDYNPQPIFDSLNEFYILCEIKKRYIEKGLEQKTSKLIIKKEIDKWFDYLNVNKLLTGQGMYFTKVVRTVKSDGYIFGDSQIMKCYLNDIDESLPSWIICTALKIDGTFSLLVVNDPHKKTSAAEWKQIIKIINERINDIFIAYFNHVIQTSQLFIISNRKLDIKNMKNLISIGKK